MAAAKATAPRKAAPKRKVTTVTETDEVEAPAPKNDIPMHPYGDKEVYVYRPKDGSAPIVFPHISEVRPTQKFFWKIYRMNEMFQSFEWMNLAGVPMSIQERVMDLGERDVFEQAEFFRGWFAPISRPQQEGLTPPGES